MFSCIGNLVLPMHVLQAGQFAGGVGVRHLHAHVLLTDAGSADARRCGRAQVVKQCVETEGVEPTYVRTEILPEFFRAFWVRRMALDRRNYRQLVETTVALAQKVRVLLLAAQVWDVE